MTPHALLDFWFADGPDGWRQVWFRRDDAFDAALRENFGALQPPADWAETPKGALALCLALDQLPRNLHRGSPLAFARDAEARAVARQAVLVRRFDLALTPIERAFLYLPFEHAELMADQDLSVTLFEGLRDTPHHAAPGGAIDYAGQKFGQAFEGTRQVVDISGDGVNNSGRPVAQARQDLLDAGVIVNGLAVLDRTPQPPAVAAITPPLDEYYRDEVIGGPGSFLMVAEGFESFETAVKRKIVREVAAAPGPLVERAFA